MRVLLTIVMCFCVWSSDAQNLTRLFKKNLVAEAISPSKVSDFVSFELIPALEVKPYKANTGRRTIYITDLSDHGQAQLIGQLGEILNDEGKMRKELSKPIIQKTSSPALFQDQSVYILPIEIDVKDMFENGGNEGRIADLTISLTLKGTAYEFYGFKDLATRYEVADFGELSQSRTRNFNLNAGINLMGTGSKSNSTTSGSDTKSSSNENSTTSNLGATFGSSSTTSEKVLQRRRVISMSGTLRRDRISFYQQGTPTNNLEGKIKLEVYLKANNTIVDSYFSVNNLMSENEFQQDSSKVSVKRTWVRRPMGTSVSRYPIVVKPTYDFNYRQIVNAKGRKSLAEGDDKIKMIYAQSFVPTPDSMMVNAGITNSYFLIETSANEKLFINFKGEDVEVKIKDFVMATELSAWLMETKNLEMGGNKLRKRLTPAAAQDLLKTDLVGLKVIEIK